MPPRRPVEITRAEGSALTRLTYTDADALVLVSTLEKLLDAQFLLGALHITTSEEKRLRRIVPELRHMVSGMPTDTKAPAVSKNSGRDETPRASNAPDTPF